MAANAEGTLDYSKLNRDLGQTGHTTFFDNTAVSEPVAMNQVIYLTVSFTKKFYIR